MSRRLREALLLSLLALSSCQKLDARPDAIGCTNGDASCSPISPIGKGGNNGRDAAANGDAAPGESMVLSGTVVVLEDDFATGFPFEQGATIYAESARGNFETAPYNVRNDFRVSGVRVSPMTWVGIKPNVANSLALPTLLALDTTDPGRVTLGAIQAQTLDRIYQIITLPTTRSAGHGQVVVIFEHDGSKRPVSGLTVDIDGAEKVIYDAAGSFTDDATVTGPAGTAILVNIPAQAFPGAKHRLLWSGAASGFQEILVAAETVTFVGFIITS